MILDDPTRPGVKLVDLDSWLVEHLSREWGIPGQLRVEDGELVFRAMTPLRCPSSGEIHYVPHAEAGETPILERALEVVRRELS